MDAVKFLVLALAITARIAFLLGRDKRRASKCMCVCVCARARARVFRRVP